MIIFGPDSFTVGANTNIDAYPATPDYAYSRGTGSNLQVNAVDDNVQFGLINTDLAARCINAAIPASMQDQEVRMKVRVTAGAVYAGGAVRYSSSTRGYIGVLSLEVANDVQIYEDNAGYTLLASADRGLASGTTYDLAFRATGPASNTELTLIIGGTAAVTFTDTTAVLGSPGVYGWRGASTQSLTWVDDFLVDDLVVGAILPPFRSRVQHC